MKTGCQHEGMTEERLCAARQSEMQRSGRKLEKLWALADTYRIAGAQTLALLTVSVSLSPAVVGNLPPTCRG